MRRTGVALATGVVLAGLLAACGGSSGGGGASSVDYSSGQSIINALNSGGFGCTSPEQNTEVVGAREDWTCQHGDESVTVTTFRDRTQKEQVKKAFGSLLSGYLVEGDAWMVGVATKNEATQVRNIIGGSVS